MAKLNVELVTAEGRVLSQEADFVLAPGADGDLGVMPHHIPLLTPLRTGEVMVRNDGVEEYLFVSGGFLEVLPDRVVILADAAERAVLSARAALLSAANGAIQCFSAAKAAGFSAELCACGPGNGSRVQRAGVS